MSYEGLPIAVRPFAEPKPAPVGVFLAWRKDALQSRVAQTFVDFVLTARGGREPE